MMEELFINELVRYIKTLKTKFKMERKAKNTILSYSNTYNQFIKFCELEENREINFNTLKEEDVYAFLEYKNELLKKQGEISTYTINAVISHLKKLFKHIERNSDKLYDFDRVFEDIKVKQPRRVPKGLSDEEQIKLLEYLEETKKSNTFISLRNIFLVKLMLFGGLRASETVSIKLSNLSLEGELYKISFYGKGDKSRTSYIKKEYLEDEVKSLENFGINKDNVVAFTKSNKNMDRVQLSVLINRVYKKAGVNKTGLHILRHSAAKNLVSAGVSIVVIQSILGHNSVQTTSIYTNPSEGMIKKEMEKS